MRTRAESGERIEPGYRIHKRQARCGWYCREVGLLAVVVAVHRTMTMTLTIGVPNAVTVTVTITISVR